MPSDTALHHFPPNKRSRRDIRSSAAKDVNGSDTSVKKRVHTKGKLAKLQVLPLEVLMTIFGFIHPYDLLQLCRTTKVLRDLLLGRSSRPTSIEALQIEPGLPECPNGVSEPFYANLVFDTHCNKCDKRNIPGVLWNLRLRLCNQCLADTKFIDPMTLGYDPRFSTLSEVPRLHELFPHEPNKPKKTRWWRRMYMQSTCLELAARLDQLDDGDPRRSEIIDERRQKNARDARERCRQWYASRRTDRASALNDARPRRKETILERLDKLGYGPMARWMLEERSPHKEEFEKLKIFKDSRELSDRVWANVQPIAIKFLNDRHADYDADVRTQVMRHQANVLNVAVTAVFGEKHLHIPRVVDLWSIPVIQEILEPIQSPADQVQKQIIFAEARALAPTLQQFDLQDLFAQSMVYRGAYLEEVMRSSYFLNKSWLPENSSTCSDLAIALFSCGTKCGGQDCGVGTMTYQQALVHRCSADASDILRWQNSVRESWNTTEKDDLRNACRWASTACLGDPCGTVSVAHDGVRAVQKILTLVEREPKNTTLLDLDALDPWFACSCAICSTELLAGHKHVFDWRHAVNHARHHTFAPIALTDDEVLEARQLRAQMSTDLPAPTDPAYEKYWIWQCCHCGISPFTASALVEHLEKRRHH